MLGEVDRLNEAYTDTLTNAGVEIIAQRAEITGPNSVRLADGTEKTAERILIAVGAHPAVPDCPGAEHGITSNEAFHLDAIPKRILIAGAGYIANEFAGVFHQFGAHVIIMNRTQDILRGYELALRDRLLQISMMKGLEFRFDATFEGIDKGDDGCLTVRMSNHDPVTVDCVMFATGRVPNTTGLGLESAGVEMDDKGAVRVDEDNRSTCDSIFAVGDVTTASSSPRSRSARGRRSPTPSMATSRRRVDYSCVPSAVFSHPPIAQVGMTESEARQKLGRREDLFVRFPADEERPRRPPGAGAVQDGVRRDRQGGRHPPDRSRRARDHQGAAVAVKAGLTKAQFDATVALHPTMAEELVLLR